MVVVVERPIVPSQDGDQQRQFSRCSDRPRLTKQGLYAIVVRLRVAVDSGNARASGPRFKPVAPGSALDVHSGRCRLAVATWFACAMNATQRNIQLTYSSGSVAE